jgi:hypothetical protein
VSLSGSSSGASASLHPSPLSAWLRAYHAAPSALAAGFGQRGKPEFWIAQGEVGQAFHIAFAAFAFAFAAERATVDAFHEAAIAQGSV